MKNEKILEAIEQGLPFEFEGHLMTAIPFDNTLQDICHWCDMEDQCKGNVKSLCEDIEETFIDRMYLAIIK